MEWSWDRVKTGDALASLPQTHPASSHTRFRDPPPSPPSPPSRSSNRLGRPGPAVGRHLRHLPPSQTRTVSLPPFDEKIENPSCDESSDRAANCRRCSHVAKVVVINPRFTFVCGSVVDWIGLWALGTRRSGQCPCAEAEKADGISGGVDRCSRPPGFGEAAVAVGDS